MINKINFLYYPKELAQFARILIIAILLGGCATFDNAIRSDISDDAVRREIAERDAIYGVEDEIQGE